MRAFTQEQKDLLRAPALKVRVLATFFLDEGTYRFCDDVLDMFNGVDTYIGASALADSIEIKSGQDLSAEPVTLICDANRMTQYGIADPAKVLSEMLGYLHQQRRIDFAFGFAYPDSQDIQLTIPAYAGKINYARLTDEGMDPLDQKEAISKLEIVIDSLASRYSRATFRTRSHADQLEIDPTDSFYSFTADIVNAERTIYWGKAAPYGGNFGGGGGRWGYGSGDGWAPVRIR